MSCSATRQSGNVRNCRQLCSLLLLILFTKHNQACGSTVSQHFLVSSGFLAPKDAQPVDLLHSAKAVLGDLQQLADL